MTVNGWHDWEFCECCGFVREVLVVEFDDLVEIECTECGFAWVPTAAADDVEARVPPRASATGETE